MDQVQFEALKSEKTKLEAKVTQLEADAKVHKDKAAALEAQVAELSKRPTPEKLLELEAKISTIQAAQLASDVKSVVSAAVAAGKPPAFFEGADADPVKFLNERFGGNLAALKASSEKLPAVVKMANSGTGSGTGASASGTSKDKLIAEAQKLVADKKAESFSEALKQVRATNPTLYAEGIDEYRSERLPGAAPDSN